MLRRRNPLVCLAFVAVALAAPAHAEEPACPDPTAVEIPRAVFDQLVGWIALRTTYDVRQLYRDPPTISFCTVGEIVAYEGSDLTVEDGLRAAYDLSRRHVYLVQPWSVDDLFDRSVLLHELIHDVQLSNREWDCIGAPEWEAYQLQDLWLTEHGISHDFNWLGIYLMSRCPSDMHP